MISTSIAKRIFKHPSRKPPWKLCVLVTPSPFDLRSNNCVGIFIIFLFCLVGCVLLWVLICFMFVLRVFVEILKSYSFVGTVFWVRNLLWLSSNSICNLTNKLSTYDWIGHFKDHQQSKHVNTCNNFSLRMDTTKDCGSFIDLDHWPYV